MAKRTEKTLSPLTFNIESPVFEQLEKIQKSLGFKSKSDLVRAALNNFNLSSFKGDKNEQKQISVRIDGDLRKKLDQVAKRKKTSLGQILRSALHALSDGQTSVEKPTPQTNNNTVTAKKRTTAKKATAKKAVRKKVAKKATKKVAAKKAVKKAVKKTAAKKVATKKRAAKKAARKSPAKKAVKKVAKKAAAKKTVAKKAAAKKATKKVAAKKTVKKAVKKTARKAAKKATKKVARRRK